MKEIINNIYKLKYDKSPTFLIGVDIGGTKTAVSLGDMSGNILIKYHFKTKPNYIEVIEDICESINKIQIDLKRDELFIPSGDNNIFDDDKTIKAIGISCGGPLDAHKGIIQSPPNLNSWNNVPIVKIMETRFDIPCFLENDANACALAEWKWGNGKGCHNLIFLTFGTGLGAGIIIQDNLYHGSTGLSGEVGHIRMATDGPVCYGKPGTWESFCSGNGISQLYEQKYGKKRSAKHISEMALQGDLCSKKIISISSYYLGMGISILIDILNPDCIIIGSIYSRMESLFKNKTEEIIKKEALSVSANHCKIYTSGLGELLGDMAALGIAADAINKKRKVNE